MPAVGAVACASAADGEDNSWAADENGGDAEHLWEVRRN